MDCLNHWIPAFAGMTTEEWNPTAPQTSHSCVAIRHQTPLSKARQAGRNAALSLLFPFPLFNIIIVHQYPVGLSLGVVELAGVDRPVERGREEGDEAERDQDQ